MKEEMEAATGVVDAEERTCGAVADDASSVTSIGSPRETRTDDEVEASHQHFEETVRRADANDATLPPLELVSESEGDANMQNGGASVSSAVTTDLLQFNSLVYATIAPCLSMLRRCVGELISVGAQPSNQAPLLQPEDEDTSLKKPTQRGPRVKRRRVHQPIVRVQSEARHPTRKATCNKPDESKMGARSFGALGDMVSANSDVAFVAFALIVLIGYCAAISYSYFHPIALPLPNVDEAFHPWDVSNVSVRFTQPVDQAEVFDPFIVKWDLTHFPSDAIRVHGIELFEYRLFLDDKQVLFELDQWEVQSDDQSHSINKTMRHPLRPHDISPLPSGSHEHWLHVEVVFAIPGSDGELQTLSDTVSFTIVAPPTSEPHVKITSPTNGSVVAVSSPAIKSSFLLHFEAYNIKSLDLLLDDEWRVASSLVRTDNFLLRGLALGNHKISLQAKNERGDVIATHTISVELRADDSFSSFRADPRDPRV